MPKPLLLELIARAEHWACRAGTTLRRRHEWTPSTFTTGRRPEERAVLAIAAEVFDLLGATPEGCVLLAEVGLQAHAGMPITHDELAARYEAWTALRTGRLAAAGGAADPAVGVAAGPAGVAA